MCCRNGANTIQLRGHPFGMKLWGKVETRDRGGDGGGGEDCTVEMQIPVSQVIFCVCPKAHANCAHVFQLDE